MDSGKYSLKEVFINKAFEGNERMLVEIFKKVFPDKHQFEGQVTMQQILDDLEEENN